MYFFVYACAHVLLLNSHFTFCYFTGDEAIISMSVAGEVTDASIMEVGRSRPQFQYSRVNISLCKCYWNLLKRIYYGVIMH